MPAGRAAGELIKDAALKVYEVQQGLTPELAAALGENAGPTFHFVLNNLTVMDNRIPPRGYTTAAYNRPGLLPVRASYADGQYWDETVYAVPAAAVRVQASVYYQTASKEYVDFLRDRGGLDGRMLGVLWDTLKSPPELMAQAAVTVTASNGPPAVVDDTLSMAANDRALIDVPANDSDPDGDALTLVAVAVEPAAAGRASIARNQIVYAPEPSFAGPAALTYTVRDAAGSEGSGRVLVQVEGLRFLPAIGR